MRFERRWANGYWRVFDTANYSTVSLWGTMAECDYNVAIANKQK